jgi:hypothetical protein
MAFTGPVQQAGAVWAVEHIDAAAVDPRAAQFAYGTPALDLREGSFGRGLSAGRSVDAEHDGCVGRPGRAPHDHHRAVCVSGRLHADRAGQQSGEAARSTVADHQQVGIV